MAADVAKALELAKSPMKAGLNLASSTMDGLAAHHEVRHALVLAQAFLATCPESHLPEAVPFPSALVVSVDATSYSRNSQSLEACRACLGLLGLRACSLAAVTCS